MLEEGSLGLAVATAVGLVGGLLLERALLAVRWGPYFRVGLPTASPAPVPRAPSGSGRTASVDWEVTGDEVRFWAAAGRRTAPTGLHGVARLGRDGAQTTMTVRWAPPWTYLLAAAWLVVLGVAREQAALTASVAAVLVVGVGGVYARAAARVVEELRAAFVAER